MMTETALLPSPPAGETNANERQHLEKEIHYLDRMEESNDFNRETAMMVAKYNADVARNIALYQRWTAIIAASMTSVAGALAGGGAAVGARFIPSGGFGASTQTATEGRLSNVEAHQMQEDAQKIAAQALRQLASDPTLAEMPPLEQLSDLLQPTTATVSNPIPTLPAGSTSTAPSRRFNSTSSYAAQPTESLSDQIYKMHVASNPPADTSNYPTVAPGIPSFTTPGADPHETFPTSTGTPGVPTGTLPSSMAGMVPSHFAA
jgi:hypothetical protein